MAVEPLFIVADATRQDSAPLQRWAARVEYMGTAYSGWQRLSHIVSVQGAIESALSAIANHPVLAVAAGRTDAKVHGLGQVIHFDSPSRRDAHAWALGANAKLPDDISLRWVQKVPNDFHARHKAFARRYRYVIFNSRTRSASVAATTAFWPYDLDADSMHAAGQHLVGYKDFSAFRGSQCQSPTPMRHLYQLKVRRVGDFVVMDVRANAFLHHMVRNIAGTLMQVGCGKRPIDWVAEVLESKLRKRAGITAPPEALTFIGPEYPPEYGLPMPPSPWFPDAVAL